MVQCISIVRSQLQTVLNAGKVRIPSLAALLSRYPSLSLNLILPERWQATNMKLVSPSVNDIPTPPLFPRVLAIPVATLSAWMASYEYTCAPLMRGRSSLVTNMTKCVAMRVAEHNFVYLGPKVWLLM